MLHAGDVIEEVFEQDRVGGSAVVEGERALEVQPRRRRILRLVTQLAGLACETPKIYKFQREFEAHAYRAIPVQGSVSPQ